MSRHIPGDHLSVGVRVQGAPVRAGRESPRDAAGPVDTDDLAVLDRGRQQRRLGLRGPFGLVRLRGQQQRQVRLGNGGCRGGEPVGVGA